MNLAEARWFAHRCQQEHNEERPHSSLGLPAPLRVRGRLCRVFRSDYACIPDAAQPG